MTTRHRAGPVDEIVPAGAGVVPLGRDLAIDTTDDEDAAAAVALATELILTARAADPPAARRRARRLARLVDDPASMAFSMALTDEVARIAEPARAVQRLRDLVAERGAPAFLGPVDRLLLRSAAVVGSVVPGVVAAGVRWRLRRESDAVVLAAEDPTFARHVAARHREGFRINVNVLGEAILGDAEAARRLDEVLARVDRPDVDYVSVKISSVCAQVSSLAFDHTVDRVVEHLRPLHRRALAAEPRVFVNLDMEEHRDLELTLAAFGRILADPELRAADVGIVLQAYLPDSHAALEQVGRWAADRRAAGGGTVKVRLVKGANLAMEQVDAELHGWPAATYGSKAEVDASYKRLLDRALDPIWGDGLRVGLASHNTFELAWGIVRATRVGSLDRVDVEMLEGMAPGQSEAVRALVGGLTLYAPVVRRDSFDAAIAYLVRRLDENTTPGNFLRHQVDLVPGSVAFVEQRDRFLAAVAARPSVDPTPKRRQDRAREVRSFSLDQPFANEPDTDWTLAANRDWIRARLRTVSTAPTPSIPLVVDGQLVLAPVLEDDGGAVGTPAPASARASATVADPAPSSDPADPVASESTGSSESTEFSDSSGSSESTAAAGGVGSGPSPPRPGVGPQVGIGIDPSAPGTVRYRYALADRTLVERAVASAALAQRAWSARSGRDRARVLERVAEVLADRRGEAIAVMVGDAGKTVAEADVEVSEAVDMARCYARSAVALDGHHARPAPLGPVVVAPPWNFPYAIPAGGVLAALAAGNAVILKPAPETVETAWLLATCLWEAGVPREAVPFLPCPDDEVGQALITHPDVGAVILTGAAETAQLFLSWRPDLRLHAETSGKNAIVVTAAADLDLAVRDLVRSAFGHAGQKCSAASLAIVEQAVLDDGAFLAKLADATRTLRVGPAADLAVDVGPLIRPPDGPLRHALEVLDPGEAWLVAPARRDDAGHLWSPGIKVGVRPGSPFHRTECFGPVLGVMAARDLDHAIELQNATDYGLTGGLHSLDPAEVDRWLAQVEVGNAYVNRTTTGAIVRRQPFGGWKGSTVGPAVKAGGPAYVASLAAWSDPSGEPAAARLARARVSYPAAWVELARPDDPTGLVAERNELHRVALPAVVLRIEADADPVDVELCELAARTVGIELVVSRASDDDRSVHGATAPPAAARLVRSRPDRLRVLGTVPAAQWAAAAEAGVHLDDRRPVADGAIELCRWTREQAVSVTNHRHGAPLPAR